jgi:hypothetical protein
MDTCSFQVEAFGTEHINIDAVCCMWKPEADFGDKTPQPCSQSSVLSVEIEGWLECPQRKGYRTADFLAVAATRKEASASSTSLQHSDKGSERRSAEGEKDDQIRG